MNSPTRPHMALSRAYAALTHCCSSAIISMRKKNTKETVARMSSSEMGWPRARQHT